MAMLPAHRSLLNVFMQKKTLSDLQARQSLDQIYGLETVDSDQPDEFDYVISTINSNLAQMGMEIFGANGSDGTKHWGIINKLRDSYAQLATKYQQHELAWFLKVVESLIASESGVVDQHDCRMPALRGKLTLAETDTLMNNMCQDGWLAKQGETQDDDEEDEGVANGITLGTRSQIDLYEYLRSNVEPPSAPSITSVTTDDQPPGSIRVEFEPPADQGGAPVLRYIGAPTIVRCHIWWSYSHGVVVTCSPGGMKSTVLASPALVSELSNGRYTLTIKAVNMGGESDASAPSDTCKISGKSRTLCI